MQNFFPLNKSVNNKIENNFINQLFTWNNATYKELIIFRVTSFTNPQHKKLELLL